MGEREREKDREREREMGERERESLGSLEDEGEIRACLKHKGEERARAESE